MAQQVQLKSDLVLFKLCTQNNKIQVEKQIA